MFLEWTLRSRLFRAAVGPSIIISWRVCCHLGKLNLAPPKSITGELSVNGRLDGTWRDLLNELGSRELPWVAISGVPLEVSFTPRVDAQPAPLLRTTLISIHSIKAETGSHPLTLFQFPALGPTAGLGWAGCVTAL